MALSANSIEPIVEKLIDIRLNMVKSMKYFNVEKLGDAFLADRVYKLGYKNKASA